MSGGTYLGKALEECTKEELIQCILGLYKRVEMGQKFSQGASRMLAAAMKHRSVCE